MQSYQVCLYRPKKGMRNGRGVLNRLSSRGIYSRSPEAPSQHRCSEQPPKAAEAKLAVPCRQLHVGFDLGPEYLDPFAGSASGI